MDEVALASATKLNEAIHAYQKAVEESLAAFETDVGRRDILRACIEKAIPRRGSLPTVGQYQIHDIGCWVERNGVEVDFDFGPDSRSDGFNPWRIGIFTKQFPESYPGLQNADSVKSAFLGLEMKGVVERLYDDSNLYFFTDSRAGIDA